MTFRERLQKEYPDSADDRFDGGAYGCPCSYGYEELKNCTHYGKENCKKCWDREMPESSGLSALVDYIIEAVKST